MKRVKGWVLSLSFVFAAAGFLLPFWPLSVAGVLLAALTGRWLFAFVVGLLLDFAWGVPVGLLHYVFFPFALLSLVASAARLWGSRFLLDKQPQDTL